jgi:hypothetical protein
MRAWGLPSETEKLHPQRLRVRDRRNWRCHLKQKKNRPIAVAVRGNPMRYQSEFAKEVEACKRRQPKAIVTVPSIMRLEEECRNFLYEAKNFIRDTLKAFNLLYGTAFEEASEFLWPKRGRPSLVDYAESTFGPDDDKTKLFKQMLPAAERVVSFRNAVEHPGGHFGTLHIENFRLDPNGKFTEPA